MKKLLSLFSLFLLAGIFVFAEDATVVYIDGWVDIKKKAGDIVEAWEGDPVIPGESVITGEASYAELEKDSSAVIKISADTVFTYREIDDQGEKRDVLSCTLGSVAFKFGKALGREPVISTPSVVAGVRGTEFTVFAGVDGSSLIAVESGKVDVTAAGKTVQLFPEEGVEVRPGEAPGDKFTVLRGKIDYSTWNKDRFSAFLDHPVEAAARVERRMDSYIEEIRSLKKDYDSLREELAGNRKTFSQILEDKGKDEASVYYKDKVEPLMLETAPLFLNLRYYALSALSMRRYVLGRMYMFMKTEYINNRSDKTYVQFLETYDKILEKYADDVVPLLVDADI